MIEKPEASESAMVNDKNASDAPEIDISAPEYPALSHRRVVAFAGPIILANLTQPLVGLVGAVVAGHLQGASNLAAVALGGAFLNLLFWNFGFLRKTTAGLAAQAFGAGDRQEQSNTLWRALAIAFAVGLGILAVTHPAVTYGIQLLGGADDVRAIAVTYVAIRMAGAALVLANSATLGYLLGVQRSGLALVSQVAGNLVHIVLAPILVFTLGWGVPGLAVAALAGETVGLAIGLRLAVTAGLRRPGASTLNRPALRRLLTANTDMFCRSLSITFALAWFTRAGAAEGTAILAANALLLQFQTFLGFIVEGFASAGQSLVGAAYGARNSEIVRAAVRITGQWATGLALLFAAGYAVWGTALIAALTDQQDVIDAARIFLPWMMFGPLVMAWAFLFDGLFMGATRTRDLRNSMMISAACFILAATSLQPYFGNHGLWAAYVLMMAMRFATLAYAHWRRPLGTFAGERPQT